MRTPILVTACCAALLPGCASQQIDASSEVRALSRYVSRGLILLDGPVLQPQISASSALGPGTVSSTFWANLAAENSASFDRSETTEVDLSGDWTVPLGDLSVTVGAAHYLYPATGDESTTELYGMLSCEGLFVTPSLCVYRDVDLVGDAYATLGLERTFDLSESLALTTSAVLGWMQAGQANYYFGVEERGFSDTTFETVLAWSASEGLELSARFAWAHVVDADYRDAVDEPDPVWGGVGVALGF